MRSSTPLASAHAPRRSAPANERVSRIPTIVLGGTGYVAGELLRLISAHPQLELAGIMSDGSPGEPVAVAFPHLASVYAGESFKSQAEIEALLKREQAPALVEGRLQLILPVKYCQQLAGTNPVTLFHSQLFHQ